MGNEFLAAKEDDPLVHSSLFADIVCGVVSGAIYAGIGIAAVPQAGLHWPPVRWWVQRQALRWAE